MVDRQCNGWRSTALNFGKLDEYRSVSSRLDRFRPHYIFYWRCFSLGLEEKLLILSQRQHAHSTRFGSELEQAVATPYLLPNWSTCIGSLGAVVIRSLCKTLGAAASCRVGSALMCAFVFAVLCMCVRACAINATRCCLSALPVLQQKRGDGARPDNLLGQIFLYGVHPFSAIWLLAKKSRRLTCYRPAACVLDPGTADVWFVFSTRCLNVSSPS